MPQDHNGMVAKKPSEIARERFAGKRVAVIGLAREGVSLARFLAEAGADVVANDRAPAAALEKPLAALGDLPVRLVLGGHPQEVFLESDVVFVSPGVPQELPPLAEARRQGIAISSETQLFFELCRGRLVGITGSSGKTTTTALTGEMLRQAGLPVYVGGNIGVPLLERVDEIEPGEWVVLEMSSFQLETLPYSPPVAAILNITPNHLDRHADMESYAAAKANIVRHQGTEDWAILNADDRITADIQGGGCTVWFSLERPVDGCYLEGERFLLRRTASVETVCEAGEVRLRGRHNLYNVAAAVAVASVVGAPVAAMRSAIGGFRGVPHRLEPVGVVDGVAYYNDSIATAPERAMASLRSFEEPIVLIAGGRDKHLPMEEWGEMIRRRVKALVLIGEAAGKIERAVLDAPGGAPPPMARVNSMEEAVALAWASSAPGDVVLLAPGCTSFDMFRDFEERGERFRECVRGLRGDPLEGERG